jgi:AraC-like DNA-binding protein
MRGTLNMSHHIKALPPALRFMEELGYSAGQCLEGTGVDLHDLETTDPVTAFTLDQEFRFHRNLLRLTGDPLLGLRIGRAYTLQSYGLFGYAFLSAPTLRQALTLARNYGPLSFTLFGIDFRVEGRTGILSFARQGHIPDDLLRYYVDRDLVAVLFGGESALPGSLTPLSVVLMHDDGGNREAYESTFGCPVWFNGRLSELHFDSLNLDAPMPLRDAEASGLLQQQCKLLLARMSQGSGFVEQVRQLIVARPGYFPDIDYVAEKLGMTSRNLRRKLAGENSSYQKILDEVRYQLAREYLGTSNMSLEEISVLLGYSTPGNFSHAFKRWHGSSPRSFRQEKL